MAKKPATKRPAVKAKPRLYVDFPIKKPRNRKAQDATLINIDALKADIAAINTRLTALEPIVLQLHTLTTSTHEALTILTSVNDRHAAAIRQMQELLG